jgi:ATP-dependent helicase Lhr and Lhr-like helicase
MAAEGWSGTSVLYLCPLKALLNNFLPRWERYTDWLGRRAAVWHGDVTAPRRRAILTARPDLLLTTPESLESMLVSRNVDHRVFFNPDRLVTWLQDAGTRPGHAVAADLPVAPAPDASPPGEVELDLVGSLQNAAAVLPHCIPGRRGSPRR